MPENANANADQILTLQNGIAALQTQLADLEKERKNQTFIDMSVLDTRTNELKAIINDQKAEIEALKKAGKPTKVKAVENTDDDSDLGLEGFFPNELNLLGE